MYSFLPAPSPPVPCLIFVTFFDEVYIYPSIDTTPVLNAISCNFTPMSTFSHSPSSSSSSSPETERKNEKLELEEINQIDIHTMTLAQLKQLKEELKLKQ